MMSNHFVNFNNPTWPFYLKTVFTWFSSSGPIPSPERRVTVCLPPYCNWKKSKKKKLFDRSLIQRKYKWNVFFQLILSQLLSKSYIMFYLRVCIFQLQDNCVEKLNTKFDNIFHLDCCYENLGTYLQLVCVQECEEM